MNELILRSSDLPSMPPEDIKQYVDVIGDAIDALKAKRNAAGHLNADKAVIDEMDSQIREYSAMKLKAEMELGKRTAAMPKANQWHGNQFGKSAGGGIGKKKRLDEINVTTQQSSDYERMAKHEEVVNRYIEHQLEIGETPTRSGAFKKIADLVPKPKTAKEMAQEKIDEIKSAPVITIHDAATLKAEQRTIDETTKIEVKKKLNTVSSSVYFLCSVGIEDFKTFSRLASKEEAADMIETLNRISGYVMKLRNILEGKG